MIQQARDLRSTAGRPEVIIAGAGPVGLSIALELAHHDVATVVFDRSPEPTKFPKMDITNGRSMELFRRLGIADRLREVGVAPNHSFDVLWAVPDGGPPVGRWDLPSVDEQRVLLAARNDGSLPLEPDQRTPQYAFEAFARELCRANPLVDLREGFAFGAFVSDDDGVSVSIVEVATGREEILRASFLVGADGAASKVRQQLRIALADDGGMPKNYMVHFRSSDRATLHRYGQFWHYFSMGSVLISQDEGDIWTFHAPLFAGLPNTEIDPNELIFERTGLRPRLDEVLLTSIWQPRFALAERYQRGRIFLAGDSVHQVFPTGGYGMNTGVGDAIDLGWKLAAVIRGWGGPRLLDSYEIERRPVAETNCKYAQRHLNVHIEATKMTSDGASRESIGRFVEANRGENEFDGIEFGYRYETSPVIVHETGSAPPWRANEYVPSTWPGSRTPSLMLADGSALFDRYGKGLTLVDFRGDAEALAQTACARGIPVHYLPLRDRNVRAAWERDLVLVRPDQHVAWRADAMPTEPEWNDIVDRVRGV